MAVKHSSPRGARTKPRGATAGVRRTHAERSAGTRAALLAAGRELFAERGFAATSRDEIAARAGVTRGALYYHFTSKEQFFGEVVRQLADEQLVEVLAAAGQAESPLEQLRVAALAYLDACLDPGFARVALLDAPAVLGPEVFRDLDAREAVGVAAAGLEAAMDAGELVRARPLPLAQLLLGAFNEGAIVIARAADRNQARLEIGQTIELILGCLEVGA